MTKRPNALPKTYDPSAYEDGIYKVWERSGVFAPASDRDTRLKKRRKPYTIVMPPPNVTGRLHAGHALMLTLEDILVRYHRMRGFDTLWLPGADHAAIATENVVEKRLLADGQSKHDVGKRKFVALARQWSTDHRKIIEDQVRALGASADWSRNAFTLDREREHAVQEAFRRLYRKGLVYRGDYMVNWCPHCRTVLADDEVVHREQEGVLYYLKYGPFELATTRPETKVGDTAVAVHPDDKRHRKWIGKTVDVQMINGVRQLTVVADEAVDPEFGTGVVKVTPFHDRTDYEIGRRHQLSALEVIDEEGRMTKAAGPLAGLDRFAARKKMVDWLKREKLLVREEVIRHSVGRCYRSDDVIEPRISKQWFLKVSAIKEHAVRFLDDGTLKFVPKRFEKTYRDWLGNMHDWCISRQVWFGHPIPAYLSKDGRVSLTKRPGYTASADTLDTWFSSALWPFSTLGWPKATADLKRFFPNDVLETGYEIIFFWVARMVLMTVALDVTPQASSRRKPGSRDPRVKPEDDVSRRLRPPFHTVYLNGIVRDKRGRKFSKSLGNGVDPLDMIGKYGTDAFRFTLATSNAPGADIRFDEERIVGSRNFANKLWNISRFVIDKSLDTSISRSRSSASENLLAELDPASLTTFDKAILHNLRRTWLEGERVFYDDADYAKAGSEPAAPPAPRRPRPYDLAHFGNALYAFVWSDFADWYLEAAKVQLANPDTEPNTKLILRAVLEHVLKLLHPYMPFITETVWTEGLGHKDLLALAAWPALHENFDQPEDARRYTTAKATVEAVRRLRADRRVAPGARVPAVFSGRDIAWVDEMRPVLMKLARLSELTTGPVPRDAASERVGALTVSLPLAGLADREAESGRLQAQIEAAKMNVDRLAQRLANQDYVSKAPQHVVAETKAKLAEAKDRLRELERQRR